MDNNADYIKILGTAGARFVVAKQLRASAGIWLSLQGKNIYIDPGPGALVKCLSSRPKLNPLKLDAIITSHKHIDHANDINIMIEAMTDSGFNKRGTVFTTSDSLFPEPIIFRYVQEYIENIQILHEGGTYWIGNMQFTTPIRHRHPVETYGLKFLLPYGTLSFITDTAYFPELLEGYKESDVLVVNVVRFEDNPNIYHLSFADVRQLAQNIKPKVLILTHFGITMLQKKPRKLAEQLQEEMGIRVIAATDGLTFSLTDIFCPKSE